MHDRLSEITARLAAVSAAPWRVREGRTCQHVESADGRFSTGCISWDGHGPQHAQFIAHAPDDLAFLLAENARLREDAASAWALIDDVLYRELREPMTLDDAQAGRHRLTTAVVAHKKRVATAQRAATPEATHA